MKTNMNMQRTLIAMAVAALCSAPMAYARDHDRNDHKDRNQGTSVSFNKHLSLSTDVRISGDPRVTGTIKTDSAAIAVVNNAQSISQEQGSNALLNNNSSIGGNVARGASGNIGANMAAGDNNAQDNAAALSATDASFAFGMSDAEVFVNQSGMGNATMNSGVINNASLGGDAFHGASGNIGVNVTSGNNNEQKNALAASVATSDLAQSSVDSNQVSSHNTVSNAGYVQQYSNSTSVRLSGPVRGMVYGFGQGGYAGGYAGTYSGKGTIGGGDDHHHDSVQNNDHSSSTSFTESGTAQGGEGGVLGFTEVSNADLYASLSGSVVTTQWLIQNAQNNASLGGNAFQGASGNIGVNVSAGTGNLQANSLALSMAQPSTTP
jgi:hypothetical protein